MKAYKIELLIVDTDEVGDEIPFHIENVRYPNDCINPQVISIQEADIGEWSDDHPLNKLDTMKSEFNKLFNENKKSV